MTMTSTRSMRIGLLVAATCLISSVQAPVAHANATGRFYDRCKEIMGGETNCRTITGMDINTVADVEKYVATPNFETCCVNCGKIARLAVETLLE